VFEKGLIAADRVMGCQDARDALKHQAASRGDDRMIVDDQNASQQALCRFGRWRLGSR